MTARSVDQIADASPRVAEGRQAVWTIEEGTLGRTLQFPAELRAGDTPGPQLGLDGTLTGVSLLEATLVQAGDRLLEVDLVPVIAAEGEVPSFRDLGPGEEGRDVSQLTAFLCAQGHGSCSAGAYFTDEVERSVRRWQESLGAPVTGVVPRGVIMWVRELPALMRSDSTMRVGDFLEATSRPVTLTSSDPELIVKVTPEQAEMVPAGARVRFAEVRGVVVGSRPASGGESDESGESGEAWTLDVRTPNGTKEFCHKKKACRDALGSAKSAPVTVKVQVVPRRTGPVVPVMAVHAGADGDAYVTRANGERVSVELKTTVGGMSVVSGLAAGDEILVDEE